MIVSDTEKRLALIHRVLIPEKEYPKEYSLLVTDARTVFIRQSKTRSSFVLRGEMNFGTALVTDVPENALGDYAQSSLESLTVDSGNFAVPHRAIRSFVMKADKVKFRLLDFFQWITMRMQKEIFQVYNFEMRLQGVPSPTGIVFYAVPIGAYFKPRRATQTRETILREYAMEILEVYRNVLPAGIISP